MGKTRSNDVIKPQDLVVKDLVADDLKVSNIHSDEVIGINSPEINIQGDEVAIFGDNDVQLGSGGGVVSMLSGLGIYNVSSLADYVRTTPLTIGTMIYSLENSKPLWLAQTGKRSLTFITFNSVSGVSGDIDIELESETITCTMTEGDTIEDVVQKMTTAINASTYYTALAYTGGVQITSKNYVKETSTPTLTCDEGVVVSADILMSGSGRPFTFVDGAGTQLEVN